MPRRESLIDEAAWDAIGLALDGLPFANGAALAREALERYLHSPRETIVQTPRGKLKIAANGEIDGLWQLCRRELRTGAEVRKLAGGVTRNTLRSWREKGFPDPVLTFPAHNRPLELWSRTAVEAWLADWRRA